MQCILINLEINSVFHWHKMEICLFIIGGGGNWPFFPKSSGDQFFRTIFRCWIRICRLFWSQMIFWPRYRPIYGSVPFWHQIPQYRQKIHYNFESNELRQVILVAIPTYLMMTSQMKAFSNLSEFQGCHIYTTGLPDCWSPPDFLYFGVISTLINLEGWFWLLYRHIWIQWFKWQHFQTC